MHGFLDKELAAFWQRVVVQGRDAFGSLLVKTSCGEAWSPSFLRIPTSTRVVGDDIGREH